MSIKFNKYFLNITLFIVLLFCLFISGCITTISSECDSDGRNCSYSPSESFLYNACYDAARPPDGYPFCDKDCDSKIRPISIKNQGLDLSNSLNISRDNLIKAYISANLATKDVQDFQSKCSNIFNAILSGESFTAQKQQYTNNLRDFKISYNQFHNSYINSLILAKKNLEEQNIEFMASTKLYDDYIKLNDIVNDYSSRLDKNILFESDISKDDSEFYMKYFSDDSIKNDTIRSIFYDSSQYTKCLIENKNNTVECYGKNYNDNYQNSISNGSTSLLSYQLASYVPVTFLILSLSGYKYLISPIKETIGATSSGQGWLNNVINSFNLVRDPNQWKDVAYGKQMFEEFANSYGPNSTSIIRYYSLIEDIDKEIAINKNNMDKKQKEIEQKTNTLFKEIEQKRLFYLNHMLLFDLFDYKFDYQKEYELLETIKDELSILNNQTIGIRNSRLNQIDILLNQISDSMQKDKITIPVLNLKCSNYIYQFRDKIGNDYLLNSYINEYEKSRSDVEKLQYCESFANEFDKTISYNCIDSLKKIYQNIQKEYIYTENGCSDKIKNGYFELKQSDDYSKLNDKYYEILRYKEYLKSIVTKSSCSDYRTYYNISESVSNLYLKNIYTSDVILSNLSQYTLSEFSQKLDKILFDIMQELSKAMPCYLSENYMVDYQNNKMIFELGFDYNLIFRVQLPYAPYISNISKTGCLNDVSIKDTYIDMKFKCIQNNMSYDITLTEPSSKIKTIFVNLNNAQIMQEICYPKTNTNKLVVKSVIPKKYVDMIGVYQDELLVDSIYDGDNITIFSPNYFNTKSCFGILYDTSKIIDFDYMVSLSEDSNKTNYLYNINLNNKLNIILEDVRLVFDNPYKYSQNLVAYDQQYNKYNISSYDDKFSLFINRLNANESKTISFEYKLEFSQSDFDNAIDNIIYDLNKISFENPELIQKAKEIESEIEKLRDNDDLSQKDKSKALLKLQKEVEIIDAENQSDLSKKARVELLLGKYNSELINYDLFYSKLFPKYSSFYSSVKPSSHKLQTLIADATSLYNQGNYKGAVDMLESYKLEDNLSKIFKEIYSSMSKEYNLAIKNFALLDVEPIYNKLEIDDLSKRFNDSVNSLDYNEAVINIESFYTKYTLLNEQYIENLNVKKDELENLISEYELLRSQFDNIFSDLLVIGDNIKSQNYPNLKGVGVDLVATEKNLSKVKQNLENINSEMHNLENQIQSYQKSQQYDKSLYKDLIKFNQDYNSSSNMVSLMITDMENNSKKAIMQLESKYSDSLPKEYFEIKEIHQQKRYVDSIYLSKQLLLNKNTDNGWYLESITAGILFVTLIIFILFRFRKGFANQNKESDDGGKKSYYKVERFK